MSPSPTNEKLRNKKQAPSSSSNEVLVKVEGVSKKFCRDLKKSLWYGVKDVASELLPFSLDRELETRNQEVSSLRDGEFFAVRDVSFELRRGECLGLIGRNGAGKTTLLKLLNGLIKPDTGLIEMRGRVGALIALGAGFNPILSGRENIYINAAILGLAKNEIEEKIDEIIDFADIGDFLDAPVQSYSSGMQVRLGFAVATALNPDVLILDEVLAVGDAAFRHKCYHRLSKISANAAVILVSHSMDHIAHTCNSVAMLNKGEAHLFCDVNQGIAAYNEANSNRGSLADDGSNIDIVYPPVTHASLQIVEAELGYGGCLTIEVEIVCNALLSDVIFSFTADNESQQTVMAWHTSRRPGRIDLQRGKQRLRFQIQPLLLHDGIYQWSFSATRKNSIEHCIWMIRCGEFKVSSSHRPLGNIPYLPDPTSLELTLAPGDLHVRS